MWVLDAGSHMVAFTIVVGVALVGVVHLHLHLHLVGHGDGKGLLGDATTAVSQTATWLQGSSPHVAFCSDLMLLLLVDLWAKWLPLLVALHLV